MDGREEPAADSVAVTPRNAKRGRPRTRGNGTGTVWKAIDEGRKRPWAAVVVVGWKTNGKAVKVTRFYETREQALAGLTELTEMAASHRGWRNRHVAMQGRSTRRWKDAPAKPRRRTLSPRVRFLILQRDGFACHYCGRRAPDVELHVDHVVPVAKGGKDEEQNLVAACAECNLGKHDLDL